MPQLKVIATTTHLYCTKAAHPKTQKHFAVVMPSNKHKTEGANLIINNKTTMVQQGNMVASTFSSSSSKASPTVPPW